MPKFIDLTGHKYGRLTVLSRAGKEYAWNCICECGTQRKVFSSSLRTGRSKSCGCLLREVASAQSKALRVTHGGCIGGNSPVYSVYRAMLDRCGNENTPNFASYGGRGIKVCPRWLEGFAAFAEDMGNRPNGGSIERIDNDKGYSPDNCRWATRKEQNRNTRRNKVLDHGGKSLCISEWAEVAGIHEAIIRQRLTLGWPVDRVLTEPAKKITPTSMTLNGRTQKVADWCRELGLPLATIRTRVAKGWSDAEALTRPVREKTPR